MHNGSLKRLTDFFFFPAETLEARGSGGHMRRPERIKIINQEFYVWQIFYMRIGEVKTFLNKQIQETDLNPKIQIG